MSAKQNTVVPFPGAGAKQVSVRLVALNHDDVIGTVVDAADAEVGDVVRQYADSAGQDVRDQDGRLVGLDLFDANGQKVVDMSLPIRLLPIAVGETTRTLTVQPRSVGAGR